MPCKIFLKKNEERRIRAGHPWVYANEVDHFDGKGKNGSLAEVYDFRGNFLGKGYLNHLSKILVRIFLHDPEASDSVELFTERIRRANDFRKMLGYLNAYRVVFAEADDLPALIIDRYGDLVSVQLLSLGMDQQKDKIIEAICRVLSPRGIYERSDVAVREKEGLPQRKGILYGDFEPQTVIEENGLKMKVDLENGQKTGYFLDQKENRFAIRRYAAGRTVLDCFCNVGGFSVNAAAAGALQVTSLDISETALADVRENASLNGLSEKIQTIRGDVFELLREYKRENRRFGMVILDPPAFCKTADEVKNATRGYKDINLIGMKLVEPGGILVTASCSHYMTDSLFERMLKDAAADSGRSVRFLEKKSQAPDHPSLLAADETGYLKFYILQVQ